MLAARRQFDGCGSAKCRWIVVLRAGWNVDDDRFGVAADVNPIDLAFSCSGEAIEGGAMATAMALEPADASACRGF